LLQLLRRCLRSFAPEEDRWVTPDAVLDPFRPGLRYPASTEREFEVLSARHLERTREGFEAADVFVFTLGLTEAWVSTRDGAVFPACPGTVAGHFDSARHRFVNFSASDVLSDLSAFLTEVKGVNPRLRTILTVSPVPLVATATGRHVLVATSYSKSVLRAAAGEIATKFPEVTYFPAYEIVTGPQAHPNSFEADRRTVSASAIREVMRAFLAACGRDSNSLEREPEENAPDKAAARVSSTALSKALSEAECEEAVSALD
jgi:GSCFA family protein